VGLLQDLAKKHKETEIRQARHFGLLLGILWLFFFALIPLLRRHVFVLWPWSVAACLWITALAAPQALRVVHRGWVWLGGALGWLNTRLILSLLYFIVILPTGLVMRLVGRDPMRRRLDPTADSYRVLAKPRERNHLERPY